METNPHTDLIKLHSNSDQTDSDPEDANQNKKNKLISGNKKRFMDVHKHLYEITRLRFGEDDERLSDISLKATLDDLTEEDEYYEDDCEYEEEEENAKKSPNVWYKVRHPVNEYLKWFLSDLKKVDDEGNGPEVNTFASKYHERLFEVLAVIF